MKTFQLSLVMMLCFGVYRSSSEILQRQKRNWIIDSFIIDESYEGPFPYSLGTVQIEKNFSFFKIRGQGVNEEPTDTLKINEHTGEITVYRPVDYEKFRVLTLTFEALSHVVDTRLGIEIKILDANDNTPEFDRKVYETTIYESTIQGTEVITIKATDKDGSDKNKNFDLRIVSVEPKPHDLEFYLKQTLDTQFGIISFKGCLNYEKAEKYTIIVEAKDHGESVQLSSSCTVTINIKGGNNHLPVITNQTGPGIVKEGQENVLVTCLQVTDEDTRGTEAWRVKFKIQGDTNNFRITTDPDTNEGLLYVQKQLDYEVGHVRTITITMENEIPFYSCKVENRKTTGLWEVSFTGGTPGGATGTLMTSVHTSTATVTVIVEDVNEPPVFNEPNKTVWVKENVKGGHILGTFTARDPDVASANTIVYIKGQDPANVITVDRSTGNITLSKAIDRESDFVKDNLYVVTIYAVDNGKPPMTSTATLSINVIDQNDNAPSLNESTIDICQADGPSWANITAVDLDEKPYSGPFNFKLLGDVKGKWKIDPVQGISVKLVKENTVYSGSYKFSLEVSDLQGKTAVSNLVVKVCNCLDTARPNCRLRKSTGPAARPAALGIILLGIVLLAGMLLLAFLVSCKKEVLTIPDESSGHLMGYNTEYIGTDCKMKPPAASIFIDSNSSGYGMTQSDILKSRDFQQHQVAGDPSSQGYGYKAEHMQRLTQEATNPLVTDSVTEGSFMRMEPSRWSMGALSTKRKRYERRNSLHENWTGHSKYSNVTKYHQIAEVRPGLLQLNKMILMLQAPGAELGDYAPHVYAEEGDAENNFELDAISMSDMSFDLGFSENLDFRFNTLASICMPSDSTVSSQNKPPSTTTSSMILVESL